MGACGTRNEAAATFCVQCGARLEQAAVARRSAVTPRRLVLLGLIGTLLVAGIAFVAYNMLSGETVEDYSPSAKGTTWEFAIKSVTKEGLVLSGTLDWTAKGEEVFEGQRAILYEGRRVLRGTVLGTPYEDVETLKTYLVHSSDSVKTIGSERFKGRTLLGRRRYLPGYTVIKLPLRAGVSWEDKFEEILSRGDRDERRSTGGLSTSIIGSERVNTPTGEFQAVVFEKRWGDGRAAKEWRVKGTGVVKFSITNPDGSIFEAQLTNFRRSKS